MCNFVTREICIYVCVNVGLEGRWLDLRLLLPDGRRCDKEVGWERKRGCVDIAMNQFPSFGKLGL